MDLATSFANIKKHYESINLLIYKEKSNEWAVDPYACDEYVSFTPIEKALWHDIRSADLVLYPQYPIGRYFVDFANPKAKVAIECDGKQYHQNLEKDLKRQREIESLGWVMYRISGKDCLTDFDEETMQSSKAGKFLESISDLHNIKRP